MNQVEHLFAGQKLRGFDRNLAASYCKTQTWHVCEGIRPHSEGISTHSLISYATVGAILVTRMFYNHLRKYIFTKCGMSGQVYTVCMEDLKCLT